MVYMVPDDLRSNLSIQRGYHREQDKLRQWHGCWVNHRISHSFQRHWDKVHRTDGPWICTFRLSLAPRCKSGREFESRDSSPRDFPGCPVIKTPPSNARGRDSIPGQGTKISCTEWCGQKWKVNKYFKKKRERERQRSIGLVASSDKTNLEIFSSAKKSVAHRRN